MTAGERTLDMVGVANYVLKAYPDADDALKPPLAPTVHALKLDSAAEQMLRRYVKERLAVRTAARAAAALALEEEARKEATLERARSLDPTAVRELAASLVACAARGQVPHGADTAATDGPTAYERPSPGDLGRLVRIMDFPDPDHPCEELLSTGECKTGGCNRPHTNTPFFDMLEYTTNATKTIDVCMYIVTCQYVADKLLEKARQPGIKIRLLTDAKESRSKKSKIAYLRSRTTRIEIRTRSPLMHEKFLIVDNHTVLSGSANLSLGAVFSNDETIMVLEGRRAATSFLCKFLSKWMMSTLFSYPFFVPPKKMWTKRPSKTTKTNKRTKPLKASTTTKRTVTTSATTKNTALTSFLINDEFEYAESAE